MHRWGLTPVAEETFWISVLFLVNPRLYTSHTNKQQKSSAVLYGPIPRATKPSNAMRVAPRTPRYHGILKPARDRGVGNQITESPRPTVENQNLGTKIVKAARSSNVKGWRGLIHDVSIPEMGVAVQALPPRMIMESLKMPMAGDGMTTTYSQWNQLLAAPERASPRTQYLHQPSLSGANFLPLVGLDNSKA